MTTRRRSLLILALALLAPAVVASASGTDTAAARQTLAPATAADRSIGRADAPVTVIEYASFSCHHCADWHRYVYPTFKTRFIDTGQVRLVFRNLPAGTYSLVIDPEFSAEKRVGVADRVRVIRDQATWSSFFFLLGFLVLLPMYSRYRVGTFEAERWKDADFLSSGADFGTGDDDGGDD